MWSTSGSDGEKDKEYINCQAKENEKLRIRIYGENVWIVLILYDKIQVRAILVYVVIEKIVVDGG